MPKNILIIEPFFSGSHRQWMEGLQAHSRYQIEFLTLPGQYWKWRMVGGATALAEAYLEGDYHPDLILASDMLDLSTFLGHTRKQTSQIPVWVYFHENQITYPWSKQDRDMHQKRHHFYGFMNIQSALCADKLLFNSHFHKRSFLDAIPSFLKQFRDCRSFTGIAQLEKKSVVAYVGVSLSSSLAKTPAIKKGPVILWNHRWEYDKNPDGFLELLKALQAHAVPFQLILLGELPDKVPQVYLDILDAFKTEIIFAGYAKTRDEYWKYLKQASLLPVTSNQDFFGISIIEAISAGVRPLLPHRLAYPELIPQEYQSEYLYQDDSELLEKSIECLSALQPVNSDLIQCVQKFAWPENIQSYDTLFEQMG